MAGAQREDEVKGTGLLCVSALYLAGAQVDRRQYMLGFWPSGGGDMRYLSSGGQIVWASTESRVRRFAATYVGTAAGAVADEAVSVCDIPSLLEACARPDSVQSTDDLHTTIDMIDDLRATADELVPFLSPSRGRSLRAPHDLLRNAIVEGESWARALQVAGGGAVVADTALLMVGRVAVASAFRCV